MTIQGRRHEKTGAKLGKAPPARFVWERAGGVALFGGTMKKDRNDAALVIFFTAVLLLLLYDLIGTGFQTRHDVGLGAYTVAQDVTEITIYPIVRSSCGYLRAVKDVSQDPTRMELEFYCAFGGLNGRIGAKGAYTLPLDPACTAIFMPNAEYDGTILVLYKNETTGQWERPAR